MRDARWEPLLPQHASYLSAYRCRPEHSKAPEQFDYSAQFAPLFLRLWGAEHTRFAPLRAIRPDGILCQLLVLPLTDDRPTDALIEEGSQVLRLAGSALGFRYCEWWIPADGRDVGEVTRKLGFPRTSVLPEPLIGTDRPMDLDCFAVKLEVATK